MEYLRLICLFLFFVSAAALATSPARAQSAFIYGDGVLLSALIGNRDGGLRHTF